MIGFNGNQQEKPLSATGLKPGEEGARSWAAKSVELALLTSSVSAGCWLQPQAIVQAHASKTVQVKLNLQSEN